VTPGVVDPCDGIVAGTQVASFCPTCEHAVLAHTRDKRCSVCATSIQIVETLRRVAHWTEIYDGDVKRALGVVADELEREVGR
jgi:hypothetical protein